MTDIVVVGAGITGLTAAYEIATGWPAARVTVLDASPRVGGKVLTAPFAGHPLDAGADAFLARVPEGLELCRRLGLADQLVSPATGQAFVYSRGALRPFPEATVLGVPTDLDALRASGIVSEQGVARAAADLTLPGEPLTTDETVGALVRRRVGDEVFERLVAPLLGGVNAGDADELSVQAGAPQLAAAVRDQPSLIAGLRAQRAATGQANGPVFFGLPTGTQTLTDTLADAVRANGGALRTGVRVTAIEPMADAEGLPRYRVGVAAGDPLVADGVVLAVPDPVAAGLLAPLVPDVAAELAEVSYASVTMVALAVERSDLGRPLDGSGFLVARPEGLLLTACSWASSKWAHLADPDVAILRASAGRHDDRRALDLGDDELVEALLADLGLTMGLRGRPRQVRVSRWADALPQFRPGHLERVARWAAELDQAWPGLVAVGAGFAGLGLPVCIRQGSAAAATLRGRLSGGRAPGGPQQTR